MPLPVPSPPGPSHRWHQHPDPIKGGEFWCCRCRTCDHHKEDAFFELVEPSGKAKTVAGILVRGDQCSACAARAEEWRLVADELMISRGLNESLALGLAAVQLGIFRTPLAQRSSKFTAAAEALMSAVFGHGLVAGLAMGLLTEKREDRVVMVEVQHTSGPVLVPAT